MTLAPRGTPLYKTRYGNFAPRVGISFQLRQSQGWETVLRGGFGVFYDLGSGSLGQFTNGFPFAASKSFSATPFPLTPLQAAPPAFSLVPPITANFFIADPNLKLPRTLQWNMA